MDIPNMNFHFAFRNQFIAKFTSCFHQMNWPNSFSHDYLQGIFDFMMLFCFNSLQFVSLMLSITNEIGSVITKTKI